MKASSIAACALALGISAIIAATAGPALAADNLLGVSWQHFREERWKKYDESCMLDQLKKYPDWEYLSTDAGASAEKQSADIETLVSRGVTALLIVPYSTDAVKPAAQMALANGIPTIGYDIQIEEPGIFYLSFDNAEVGRIQARGVLDVVDKGRFAYIKGSPTMEITEFVWGGQVEILTPYIEKGDIEIVCELYSDGWLPENAQINMEQCLTANDNRVDAVVASNDGTAGGVVAALASQGLAGNIPVSGQDGDIAALNRIAKGYQTVSAWKNACDLGRAGVDIAVALAEGTAPDQIEGASKFCDGPNKLCQDAIELAPVAITRNNLNVVLDAGWISKDELCAGVDAVPETVHGTNPPAGCE